MGKQLKSDGGNGPRFTEDGELVVDGPKFNDNGDLIIANGTTPDLKKKGSTELPADGGSSGLPKIKYNGKEYGYNATTLQVFEPDGTELKQVQHLGKTYDVKDYLTNVIGVKPQTQKPQAEKPISGQKPFEQGLLDRQQGAIIASQAPEVQSDRLIKRNKKFPSIKDNPQVVAAFDAYDNLKNAAAKTADKQNEYDLFLKTGTFTDESGQDIRPLGAIPTDVLGTTTVVEGSPAAEIKKKLENDLKVAKEDENKAYDDLGNKENTFKNVKVELPVKKELGADKYEYEMPSQVGVLNFMQSLSDLEDHADGLGMSLPQYSDSVENIASDAFLSPDQQNLFKELNSGDERAARSAIARYDENIDKQINAINKQLALGATPAQKAYLINERTRLTDEKSDFFSPKKAIEGAMTINPQLKPVFDAFVGIGDQDKASLVYAKVFKDSQDLADELIGQPLFIDQDGKQVLNPKVTDYLVGGQDSPFRRKSADKRELLQKNINTLNLLAKATLLNRRPLEKKGSFIESFGKTLAKGIGFDTGFTQTMVETDKPSVVANFLADATISTRDLPTNQAKQLEQIGKQSNWEFAGSTLGYLIPAGVQLAVGGAELRGLELIANALKRTSTAAALASDVIKITRGSSMLSKAVKMGADAQLGGWTFNDPEMGFANIGAESLAGELFEKAIKKLPGGALVTKVAKKVFADNYLTAMNKIGKANAYGLGETTGEFAGSLVQLYQDSDTWNDFYDKFQQQFGKAEENLKFFLSCYSLGTVTGNHAAPATKAIDSAADKAYQKLTPDEKKIADEVIENDVDATNVATVDVLRNNVQVVPDADLKTRIEQVKKAKEDLDALPDLKANTQNAGSPYVVPSKQGEVKNAKDGAYEIKVGDITLSGNTPEQLANDKDLINSLDLIYSGEQQRREAEGITVETPPIETGEVNPEATDVGGVGVEGEVVPEADNFVSNLKDDEDVTITVATLDEVPAKFKDRAIESKKRLADVQKSFLGIPYGKKERRTVNEKSYTYTATGKEIKDEYNATKPLIKAKPEAGVGVEGEVAPEAGVDIQTKQKETEAKIKRKDLFADGGSFANQLGGSGENSVPTNHREVNGIEFVEFSNPTSGVVDVVMTGTSDTDFVGYYRIYENGKPTNKWSSKFENQSRNKANFKTMISGAQEMLPQGHEYTEKTSISTDGLRVWGQQLERGYELQRDANGKLKTNRVAINGDAIENELGIPVNKGNFDNVSVTNNADMKKVKAALLPYLQKFGLDENNIHFENGTVEIDLPVLKQTTTTQAAPTTTTPTTTTQTAPQGGVTEPTKAPVIKAQVVGTTNGFNTIIDGGLGKQQDPRFTGEVQQGKSIFKVNPNNNESSFLDISLPSTDSYGRSGGVQIRFELPNGIDANTVFEAVKKEAAKLGQLDAKDPDFQQKVQGLVDKGIAEIQGLATGGAGQAAQVKEVVSDTQVTPTTNVNPALKNVASTATALSKLDKGTIDATLPMQPLEIDGYKREYRTDDPISIAEAYHKAKADKSNPDLVNAVEELLAPKGEAKAEPSVKGEAKKEAAPTTDQRKAEVASVFNSNPELAKIGTQQQYSQYLDSIFPNSKVKDIVYHGSASKFDKFEKEKLGINTQSPSAYNGFFFAKDKDTSLSYIGEQVFEYSQEYIDYVNQFRNELDRLENEINKTFADRETILKKLDNLITKLLDFINGRKLSAKEKELAVKLENLYDEFKKTREKDANLQRGVGVFVKKFNKDVNDVVKTYIKQKENTYLYRTILNIEKPNYHNDKNQGYRVETYNNRTLEDKKNGYDGTIIQNTKDLGSYVVSGNYDLKNPVKPDTDVIVVYEPDKIHILGTKQDIDGFKEFVANTTGKRVEDAGEKVTPTEKVEAEPTADINNVADKAGIAPKNLRDLYNINQTLFGLNKVKSLAAAVAMDRMVGVMAKRAGTTKSEMYARLRFKKASEQDLKDKNVLWQGASALSNFDKWKGSNELLGGAAIQDAKTGQPIVVRVYHGTTNDFYEFDASIKGNVEGHLGKVNYFTSDYQDAANNYQAEGADLTNRIGSRKDSIEQELENTYDDFFSDKNRIAKDYGYTGNQLTALGSFSALAADIAEKELKGGTERVLDVFVKLNNPVVLGNGSTWFETLNVSESDLDQAAQEIADENDISIDEAKEDYEYDIRSRAIENTGYGNLAEEALSDALNANGYDGSMAAELLGDGFYDTEIDLNKLEKDLRKAELYENEQGEIASSQVIADFFKNLGFDGIILTDVSNRFKGMGIGGSTSHVHVFDNFSNQIKLADGSNTSFSETRDIRFQKNKGKAQGAVMVTMDGNAVIYALTDPNVSTPLHEVAHVFEHYLTDSERATVNNWAKTGAWTTETSEKFARGFEKYLSEGVAPTEGLKKVFEKFKTWLTDIYNGIKGSNIDIELNDDMRSIYAQMLGEDAVPTKKAKAAPKKAKKAAIQSDVIDKLVGKATDRRAAVEAIADENIKEFAKAVTDTKVIDKVMDAIDNNDQLLADLEKKLGMKKICKVF